MRNGHLSHGGTANGPLAIDLSSARVRLAQGLLDGVRPGQPLGALLGYRFERGLHDAGSTSSSTSSRTIAPGAARTGDGPRAAAVVDGLELHRRLKTEGEERLLTRVGVASSDPRRRRVLQALATLDDAIDAVADAVSAESVHQLLRGNLARSAGSLDAIASGQAPPPELDVVRTPRTGVPVTHRVALLFSAKPAGVDRLGHAGGVASRRGRAGAQRVGGQPAGTGRPACAAGWRSSMRPAAWCGRTRFC